MKGGILIKIFVLLIALALFAWGANSYVGLLEWFTPNSGDPIGQDLKELAVVVTVLAVGMGAIAYLIRSTLRGRSR